MTAADDLQAHRDLLITKLNELGGKFDEFTKIAAEDRKRIDRQRFVLRLTVAGLVLDLVLSVLVGIGYLRQQETTETLAAVVAELQRQRSDALCPLFAIFIGAYDPSSRAEGPARDAYEDTYVKIRKINNEVLGCTQAPVPGRKPTALGPTASGPVKGDSALINSILFGPLEASPVSPDVTVLNTGSSRSVRETVTSRPQTSTVTVRAPTTRTSRSVSSGGSASRTVTNTAKAATGTVQKTTKVVGDTVKKTTKTVSGTVSKTVGSVAKGLKLK